MLRQAKLDRAILTGILAIAAIAGLSGCNANPQNTALETTDTHEAGSSDLPSQGVEVVASFSDFGGLFQTEVVNIGLEKLGYDVESPKQLGAATAHVDLANGGTDYSTMHWENTLREFYLNSGGDEKLMLVGHIVSDTAQGYAIDKATAEEKGISSLDQLQDPAIAQLFDSDGDGKANLTGCNTGWGCEVVIEHHLDAYGLRDTVEHDQGKYDALIADTITRYKQGQPILYYTWTPYWVSAVLVPGQDTTWLEVPNTDLPEAQGNITAEQTTVNGKNLGFPIDQMRIIVNREFGTANPAAVKFFESVKIPLEDITKQNERMHLGEDSPEDIRRHAEEWIVQNQEQFDRWLDDARQAGKAPIDNDQ